MSAQVSSTSEPAAPLEMPCVCCIQSPAGWGKYTAPKEGEAGHPAGPVSLGFGASPCAQALEAE